jgi:glycerophosphoryl diester phosphodiesterase
MKTSLALYSFILLLFLLGSCKEQPNTYFSISIPENIKLIGHKGSGSINENGNIELMENTWASISNSINAIDGSEIDLQLSADSTLWIFHDHKIKNCQDSLINFFLCSDKEILKIRNCNYENSLLDISSFLRKAKSENWKNKTLCLDLKLLYNPQINQSLQEREELLAFATKRLESTFKNTQFDLLIEIFNEKQYTYLDSIFQDKTFLVNYSPTEEFIKEMNEKSRKLSLPIYDLPKNLDPSNIEIKNLWTINTVNQFIEGLRFSPKIMQSDNIPMMHFFKSIQEGKRALRICSKNNVTKIKDNEFQSLLSLELPLAKEQLIEFKTIKGSFKKGVLLVFKAADENGNTVLWEKEELSENLKSYFFINSKFLVHKKSKTIQISIWNKSGSALNNTFNVSQFELH